ncbi:MAG: hypothetical protein GQ570_06875 [Helicobacteraceae bacterium]|nr:hypothetical protein [Helicobacteraceae bacterium]
MDDEQDQKSLDLETTKQMYKIIESLTKEYFNEIKLFIDKEDAFLLFAEFKAPSFNYITIVDVIFSSLKNLLNIDMKLNSGILDLMQRDIKELIKIYSKFNSENKIPSAVFSSLIVKNINILPADSEIVDESLTLLYDDKAFLLKRAEEEFIKEFEIERDRLLRTLKNAINTKLFLFDQVLWYKAQNSYDINKFFNSISIEGEYSLVSYLKYTLNRLAGSKAVKMKEIVRKLEKL